MAAAPPRERESQRGAKQHVATIEATNVGNLTREPLFINKGGGTRVLHLS